MSVLILAQHHDEHAAAVAAELEQLGGHAEVVDTSHFPDRARLVARFESCEECRKRLFLLELERGRIDLADVGAAWWRRPHPPAASARLTRPDHQVFAVNETHEALRGLWHALDVFWINDPGRDEVAHRKLLQLRVAQDVGLEIPSTLVTNDVAAARSYVDARAYRDVICKAFSATEQQWRETRLVGEPELAALENVRYAPVIFQEYVPAEVDLRVTVVGQELFTGAIYSQESEYPVDFRMDMGNTRVEADELPAEVAEQLLELMARLGIVYGAIDLRRTPDGRHVFLEVNPAGQWLFVEQATGQPIARALAQELLAHDRAAVATS
ncbi:MAG: MvdC/MvdD family ATP grasp protein [Solirubrobacteraceae bacterium]